MWWNEISMNTEEIRWISRMIPKSSLAWVSKLIARMSVRLSEKILIRLISSFTASMIPNHRANASATIGEGTLTSTLEPCLVIALCAPLIIQAKPAFCEVLFHAASDLHVAHSSCSIEGWLVIHALCIPCFFFSKLSWAWIHSLASFIPLAATSFADSTLFSNMCVFLVVHNTQQIQGKIFLVIPDGGRQVAVWNFTITSWMESPAAMRTAWWRGTLLQTSFANGQVISEGQSILDHGPHKY